MPATREFCRDVAVANAEPLAGTASRVDHWILIEYRGLWARDVLPGSGLSDQVKQRLREQASARPHTKLLFVRRTERRGRPELRVMWGSSPGAGRAALPRRPRPARGPARPRPDRDPARPLPHPLLLVCTHGKHDRCCARQGRPLYQALAELAEDELGLAVSHVGGDRFAGNVVVLPEGLYYGRVGPAEAWSVLDEYLARPHRPRPLPRAFQLLVRGSGGRASSPGGGGPVRARRSRARRTSGRSSSSAAGGRLYEVDVTAAPGALSYLTCSSEALRRPRHYAARILRERAA